MRILMSLTTMLATVLLASATGLAADGEPATVAEPEAQAEVLDLPYIIGAGDPRCASERPGDG